MGKKVIEDKIEKLVIILLIAFILTTCLTIFTKTHIFFTGLADTPIYTQFTLQTKFITFIYSVFAFAVPIGSAIWLFKVSKESNSRPWLWTFLGLFAGIFAVILWYLQQILKYLEKKDDNLSKPT